MNKKTMSGIISAAILVAIFFSSHSAQAEEATTTETTSTPEEFVTIHVRYQDTVAFEGTTTLPIATTTTLADSTGIPHPINSRSALNLLSKVSASTTSFSLSNLQYFSSFGSFYVKCLDIAASTTIQACDNWQYAVNSITPFVGSDQYIATSSDNIYFYFGNQRQFSVSATTTTTDSPIQIFAQKYDFENNSWLPLGNAIVNATEPDPTNPWSPFVIASSTTNASGTASLLFSLAGGYDVGLADDGYYPTHITVASSTSTSTDAVDNSNGNGSGGTGNTPVQKSFDLNATIQFLTSKQQADGSFGSALYTDWAAIALSSISTHTDVKQKTAASIVANPDTGTLVTDAERRAMALMALGINPYSGTSVNYIKKITDSFDGTQIGDPNIYNDDIFALFPLLKAGYSASDPIISQTVRFIISKQSANGAWLSTDMTAATIQALSQVQGLDSVSDSLTKAKGYLKSQQNEGGFGTSYSTSWALQAINALGESPDGWQQNGVTPLTYLATFQQTDGGVEQMSDTESNRIWATAYAIPAAQGKTWISLLTSFSRPQTPTIQNQTSQVTPNTATTTSTSTIVFATTTRQTPTTIKPVVVKSPAVVHGNTAIQIDATSSQESNQPVQNPAINADLIQSTSSNLAAARGGLPSRLPYAFGILGAAAAIFGVGLYRFKDN